MPGCVVCPGASVARLAPYAYGQFAFIRKPASDLGWDWGPALAPAGLHGSVRLERYCLPYAAGVHVLEQEFMFACNPYPNTRDFNEEVRLEAEEQVRRLAGHPSVALWGGNNELDPGRPYLDSSPSSGLHTTSVTTAAATRGASGPSSGPPTPHYGTQSFASAAAVRPYGNATVGDWAPTSAFMRHSGWTAAPPTAFKLFEPWIYQLQVQQALCYSTALGVWRSGRSDPQVRRLFRPVTVVAFGREGGNVTVFVVNDGDEPVPVWLAVDVFAVLSLTAPPQRSLRALQLPAAQVLAALPGCGARTCVVSQLDGEEVDALVLLVPPKVGVGKWGCV
eukprot:XP_001697308.1 predicted protein [Chlamydomonas reinhardtii]